MKPYQVVVLGGAAVGLAVGAGYAGWVALSVWEVKRHNELRAEMLVEAARLRKRMELDRGEELEAQAQAMGVLKAWPNSKSAEPWVIRPARLCAGSGQVVTLEHPNSGGGAPFRCEPCGRILRCKWRASGELRELVLPDHLWPSSPGAEGAEQVADGDDADFDAQDAGLDV